MHSKKSEAIKNNLKLKHVAVFENNQINVELINVDDKHPFYNLSGSDNMIIIRTKYYDKNPLIIRGPGAGAEVTAAGIISDIYNI